MAPPSRSVGELTSPEISEFLCVASILMLPIGAIEQHGAHLPLNTDVVIARELTRRIIARWGDEFDLWRLPTLSLGLSREHDWAAGTLSLTIANFVGLVRDIGREIARSLPARHLVIVSGHGGNRGILENIIRELDSDFGLNVCVIHPFDLSKGRHRIGWARCPRWSERNVGDAGAGAAPCALREHRASEAATRPRCGRGLDL